MPAAITPVAYEVVQAVFEPESRRQVWLAIATLSVVVIAAVWLAVELVGEVSPVIETLGAVWSTTIVAVWVVTFPLVSVATTVIVLVPTVRTPLANEVVHAAGVPLFRRQVCEASATLSLAVIVAVWLVVKRVGEVTPVIETAGAVWSTTIVAV